MTGKISRLPQALREELNRRLADAEPHKQLLVWLNSLPEVKRILAEQFRGRPISKQNLYEWTQYGFRNWKMRQDALEFAADEPDASGPAPSLDFTEKLVQWLALRFAAFAHSLIPDDSQPDAELRRLHSFAADIVALRRGDLYNRRIVLEERRAARLERPTSRPSKTSFGNGPSARTSAKNSKSSATKPNCFTTLFALSPRKSSPFSSHSNPSPPRPMKP